MLIFHISTINSLEMILQSKHLKSTSLLKKEKIEPLLNYGDGIYDKNKFIYFGCINELLKKKYCLEKMILFYISIQKYYTTENFMFLIILHQIQIN